MELPALAVAACIPCILAVSPPPNDDPFRRDNPADREESLEIQNNHEAQPDEAIDRRRSEPRRTVDLRDLVALVKIDASEDLRGRNGAYRPVGGGKSGDEDVDGEDHEIREYEERCLALVEGAPERSDGISREVFPGTIVQAV